ncbi:uncharacterized protein LOC131596902 [Vicia villosa]|uniref:uncharacterized protein LOC131596902 n=1 Tax=Vicia villosa TaxID=3911 RepID=UPI00273B7F18|nr:uncharacterized protein LOC131596902 [Vicia villosa]
MGFLEKWLRWIKECLNSASISVLVNGCPTKEFKMGRGLRQGDPLSPFLFLIAAEGLIILMSKAEERGLYTGSKFQKGADRFSHLQYVDDTMIVGEKSWSNIRIIKANLKLFEMMSGLKVNFQKSSLTSINIPPEWITEAARIVK